MLSARKRRPSWIATRLTLDTSKARAAAIASLDLGGTSSRERESSRGERKSARESSSGERRSARERLNHRITDAERAVRGVLTDFDAEQRIARKKGRRKLTKRDHLYLGLNSPSSSCWALLVALLLTLATLAAAVSYAFSTIEGRVAAAPNTFRALDALYAFIFTSEVLLRLIAAPSWRQMVTPLVVLEAICLVPLYARLCFGPGDIYADADAAASVPAWMRYFDALGPLRLLKLARYYSDAALLGVALRRSFSALMVPLSFMAMLCLCFASVLYAIEARPVDASADAGSSTARVANVPDAIWLMLITMTTVGYGDFYPTTPIGRLVVSCAALCGVVIIAMPLAIIGHNFNEAWNSRELQLMVARLRLLLIEQQMGVNDVFSIFSAIDTDHNGTIDFLEFRTAVEKLDLSLAPDVLRRIWKSLDDDRNGYIDYFEFCERCFPELGIDLGHYSGPSPAEGGVPYGPNGLPSLASFGKSKVRRGSVDWSR